MTARSKLLRAAGALALSCLGILPSAAPAAAQSAPVFTIRNKTGLPDTQVRLYYLGAGMDTSGNFIVLMPNGTWATAGSNNTGWNPQGWNTNANGGKGGATGAGVVPCYPAKGGESVTIPLNAKSMRVYLFQVRKGQAQFNTPCMTAPAKTGQKFVRGAFGTTFTAGDSSATSLSPFAYTLLTGNGGLIGPKLGNLKSGNFPAWAYGEIGAADIDVSQVDAIPFPVNITAKLSASPGSSYPLWNMGVGFTFNGEGIVNMQSIVASYRAFVATLPQTGGTAAAPTKPQRNYANLVVGIPGGLGFLTNPGKFLGEVSPGGPYFINEFTNLANNYMWKNWTGKIDNGGATSGSPHNLPQTVFTGSVVTLPSYPGYKGKATLTALKFTGNGVSAYVLSPATYQTLCIANAIGDCTYMSTAYQIFAADGALTTPVDGNQFLLLSGPERQAWAQYGGEPTYNTVVSRLGLIISMAYNRGVAGGLSTTGGLCADKVKYPTFSACWSDQALWYPKTPTTPADKAKYFTGDTTQNEFSRWLHTAQIGTAPKVVPMMTRPNNPAVSANGVMGMGYGFAVDENPTPPFNPLTMAQTPSEYSSNVAMDVSTGCNYITFSPLVAGVPNWSPVSPACAPAP